METGVRITRPRTRTASAEPRRRRNNNVTLLTTTRAVFDKVRNLREGQSLVVECPNDIISSARNGRDNVHHSIRRVELLRRSLRGGHRAVRVRWEQGNEVCCLLGSAPVGMKDAPTFRVRVERVLSSAERA